MKLPLGGSSKDFDSKQSRAEVINLIPEGDKDGEYRTVKKVDGLTLFATFALGPVRSIPFVNSSKIYVVSGSALYRVSSTGVVETLGTVGGTGRAEIKANAVPGDNQIGILNGSGAGYIYTNLGGLVQITDPDFFSTTSMAELDERFWFSRDGRNEFFGSDQSDGTAYSPLTFGSADESPDAVVAVVSKKSALWVLGSSDIEYFQRFNDPDFPLRAVKGATQEYGLLVKNTLAEDNDYFAYLADDRTVKLLQGTQLIELSDYEFQTKIAKFTTITDAYGFFVDGPLHSIYYITFPTEGYTKGFDLKTGQSHQRKSEGYDYWRVNGAVKFGEKIICGDSIDGKLWVLDTENKTENDVMIRTKLVTPSVSWPKDGTVSKIELSMEVAQTDDPTITPVMMVSYTKDGGKNWVNKGTVPIGNFGQHDKRVVLRNFGRLVRNKDFALRLETTDKVGVQYYGAEIEFEESI
jgi:hypothetical protein